MEARPKRFWKCLQHCCKCLEELFGVCGESRKSSGICFGVCGESRKSPGICFDVCGSPASLPAFTLAFAEVPQVSRHLLWRLREPRKCFGELVGRCSMLSMTFSIRVSHSFVELTLYNTDIKPCRANPYVKRTPHRSHTPSPA